jgi:hypothetical protein
MGENREFPGKLGDWDTLGSRISQSQGKTPPTSSFDADSFFYTGIWSRG